MKIKFIVPLLFSIIIGFVSAKIVYSIYDSIKTNYNAYLLQIGAYKEEETLNNEVKNLNSYVTVNAEDLTYVYVGVTTNKINADKIKKIYENNNMNIYIKPVFIDNINFYSNLEQYDILLSSVEKESDILSINDVILSDYEQMVIKS